MDTDTEFSLEDFLQAFVPPDILEAFLAPRVTLESMVEAIVFVARNHILNALRGRVRDMTTDARARAVLQLRDMAEEVWGSLKTTEPCFKTSAFDARGLMEALRAEPREDADGRLSVLATFLVRMAKETAQRQLTDVRHASLDAKLHAAAVLIRRWEATSLREVHAPEPADTRLVTQITPSNAADMDTTRGRAPLGAPRPVMKAHVDAYTRRLAEGEQLTTSVLRELQRGLQTSSITGVLSFCYHVLVGDWEDMFLAPLPTKLLGVPAMLREARAWRADEKNPALIKPKAEGGALPPPTQFVYTVGKDKDGHVGYKGRVLLPGGGLLAVLPGWHGSDEEGNLFAHYWRVNPATRVASLLRVAESGTGHMTARVKLSFEVDLPEHGEEEEEEDRPVIDWIDAQRDFEGNLVLSWGGYNRLTGGVAWTCYMGLTERDEYPRGVDPFRTLEEADVDDMFVARLESAEAIDFRDHGNLMTAEVRHVEEVTPKGRFFSPTTSVVYHQTIVNELVGVEATAVWGTAAAYVVWTKDGHAATVHGASERHEFQYTLPTRGVYKVPAMGSEASIVSIAPWWSP